MNWIQSKLSTDKLFSLVTETPVRVAKECHSSSNRNGQKRQARFLSMIKAKGIECLTRWNERRRFGCTQEHRWPIHAARCICCRSLDTSICLATRILERSRAHLRAKFTSTVVVVSFEKTSTAVVSPEDCADKVSIVSCGCIRTVLVAALFCYLHFFPHPASQHGSWSWISSAYMIQFDT